MMGYIFLLLSVFTNATKGYASKYISNDVHTVSENIYVNIIPGDMRQDYAV